MAKHTTADLRNVVLMGHGDAGKTSLADSLLAKAGAVTRAGSVKDGTSLFDSGADEKERKTSIDAAVGHCRWKDRDINIIDTPGYPDFIGEAVAGLNGADVALICVNAHAGVMVNTRHVYNLCQVGQKVPRAIVVTKCDLELHLQGVLQGIREAFGERCIPYRAPPSLGDFSKQWTEAIVSVDDDLAMRYLEDEAISEEELNLAALQAFCQREVVPVLFVSSEKDEGLEELLDFIASMVPSPEKLPRRLAAEEGSGGLIAADGGGPFMGLVWNLQVDRHVGKVGHVRVLAGSLKAGDTFYNLVSQCKEKVGHIFRAQGREHEPLDEAVAGDLVVLTKIDSLKVGDTLSAAEKGDLLDIVPFPAPMFSLAITPKSRGDEGKISQVLARLCEESPTFKAERRSSTGELVVSGMSQLHLDFMLRRMKDRFGLLVDSHTPKVPFLEAIAGKGDARYRHKKQTGGRGQFAEVALKVSPGESGQGLEFSWDIFGGSIPKNFEAAIIKGIQEKMHKGCVAGYTMRDIKVSVYDGKFHDVDSSEAAFKMAGGKAFEEAVGQARPIILEPIVKLEITIPGQFMGDVSGDLNTRRGRIHGMEQQGTFQIIKAELPLAEAMDYSRVLTSITSGEGSYTMEPSRYEKVPAQVQQELVAAYKPHGEED